jgi:uncharacterized protein YbaR (Trm112 family)
MITATCPECKLLIQLVSAPEIGRQLICVNCSNTFEVIWLFPVILDYLENDPKTLGDPDKELE